MVFSWFMDPVETMVTKDPMYKTGGEEAEKIDGCAHVYIFIY